MPKPQQVYVGVGSNLDSPLDQVRRAVSHLQQIFPAGFVCSPLYQTRPIGPQDQPDFINAVVGFMSEYQPQDLLGELQQLESAQGRVREDRQWGPRTLDLDILLHGDTVMQTERLTIPHPEMHKRGFVLKPLHDIASQCHIPGQGSVQELLQQIDLTGVVQFNGQA